MTGDEGAGAAGSISNHDGIGSLSVSCARLGRGVLGDSRRRGSGGSCGASAALGRYVRLPKTEAKAVLMKAAGNVDSRPELVIPAVHF